MAVDRHQDPLRQRRTGGASEEDLREFQALTSALEAEPAPPEFREAISPLARDSRMLAESMRRIETFAEAVAGNRIDREKARAS